MGLFDKLKKKVSDVVQSTTDAISEAVQSTSEALGFPK